MISMVLAAVWGLALSWWNPAIIDLIRGKVIIPIYTEMSIIITLLSAKISALTESTILGVLAIIDQSGLSSLWNLFLLSRNNLTHL